MVIYSGFSHWKWWFSIVMLVYQRVEYNRGFSYQTCLEESRWQDGQGLVNRLTVAQQTCDTNDEGLLTKIPQKLATNWTSHVYLMYISCISIAIDEASRNQNAKNVGRFSCRSSPSTYSLQHDESNHLFHVFFRKSQHHSKLSPCKLSPNSHLLVPFLIQVLWWLWRVPSWLICLGIPGMAWPPSGIDYNLKNYDKCSSRVVWETMGKPWVNAQKIQ